MYVAETMHSVLIKGGVLISRVVLYTSLCCWDNAYGPGVLISGVLLYIGIMHNNYSVLIKGDVLISGVVLFYVQHDKATCEHVYTNFFFNIFGGSKNFTTIYCYFFRGSDSFVV